MNSDSQTDHEKTGECNEYLSKLMNKDKTETASRDRKWENERNWRDLSYHFDEFEEWGLLPADIKCKIIEKVDFVTRCALLFVSKSMHQLNRKVPVHLTSVVVLESERWSDDEPTTTIMLFPRTDQEVTFVFTQEVEPEQTHLCRTWTNGKGMVDKDMYFPENEYRKQAASLLENVIKFANYQVDEFEIYHSDLGSRAGYLKKLHVKKRLGLYPFDTPTFNQWCKTAKSPLEEFLVEIRCGYWTYFNSDHITARNAKKFHVSGAFALSDSSFLKLKCEEIWVHEAEDLTDNAINKFLKRWADGGGPENFRRLDIYRGKHSSKSNVILAKLDHFEWNDNYRKENQILCEWIDKEFRYDGRRYYHVHSKNRNNGATLVIATNFVVFLVTGNSRY